MYQIAFRRFENAENSVPRKMVEIRHHQWLSRFGGNNAIRLLLCLLIEERKSSNC